MLKALNVVAVLIAAGFATSTQAATLPAVGSGTLKFHLDAGVGVTTSGGLVTQWNDQSGGGNHFVQANLAQSPALTVGLNGLPTINFTSDRLDAIAGHTLNNANALDFTIFAVTSGNTNPFALFDSRPGQANVFRYAAFSGANPSNPGNAVELWDSTPFISFTTNTNGSIISTQASLAPTRVLDNRVFGGASVSAKGAFSASTAQIGFAEPDIGTINGGGNGFYSGNISEMIYYQGRLSVQDQFNVENYLRAKYNVNPIALDVPQLLPNPAIVAASTAFGAADAFGGTFFVHNVLDGNPLTDYASNGQGTNTFIDFDFGGSTLITQVNYTDRMTSGVPQGTGPGGPADNVTSFDLIFSDDAIFGNGDDRLVSVLSPGFANTDIIAINGGRGFSARFVRWDVTGISGPANNNGAGEIQFFSTLFSIPEPGTLSLLGMAGLALLRRRRSA